jgi:hypothetical protein
VKELKTMTQTVPEQRRDTGPEGRLRRRVTSNEQEPNREGGLAVSLWLLAALIAEAELFLWLLERAYCA